MAQNVHALMWRWVPLWPGLSHTFLPNLLLKAQASIQVWLVIGFLVTLDLTNYCCRLGHVPLARGPVLPQADGLSKRACPSDRVSLVRRIPYCMLFLTWPQAKHVEARIQSLWKLETMQNANTARIVDLSFICVPLKATQRRSSRSGMSPERRR